MELSQQVTSLELSKRLKELGVKQESHFYWNNHKIGQWGLQTSKYSHSIAAYTVAELGELLPKHLSIGEYGNREFRYLIISHSDGVVQRLGRWYVYYDLPSHVGKDYQYGMEADNEADSRGLMLAYLKENNLI